MRPDHKLTIAILPVMLELYRRLVPQLEGQLNEFAAQMASGLSGENLAVTAAPVVCDDSEIKQAVAKFQSQPVDLLVIAHVAYAPSGQITPALLETNLPILLWPAQPALRLSADKYDDDAMLANHGVHGTQDLANILRRSGRPFGVLHGHWQQDDFYDRLLGWAHAGRFLQAARTANPIVIGGHFVDMNDLQLNNEPFVKKLGLAARYIDPQDLAAQAKQVEQRQIEDKLRQYHNLFDLADGLDENLVARAARFEIALRTILQAGKCSALGINFIDVCNAPDVADALHVPAGVLMSEGIGYGAEGDWTTAVLSSALMAAGCQASFTEVFSVSYADDYLIIRHWGEANIDLARNKPVLSKSSFTDKIKSEFAIINFEFQPGPCTLVNINAAPDGRGQLLGVSGQVLADHLPLSTGPRGVFKPYSGSVAQMLTDYANLGGSHHLVLVYGDCQDLLSQIASLAGWEYIEL